MLLFPSFSLQKLICVSELAQMESLPSLRLFQSCFHLSGPGPHSGRVLGSGRGVDRQALEAGASSSHCRDLVLVSGARTGPPVSACPWQCPGRVSETHSLLKTHPGSQSPVTVLRSPQVPALMNPFDLTSPSSADLPQLLPVLSPPASALLASWPRGTVPRWGWAPLAVGSEGEMSSVPGKKGSSVS